MNTVYVPNRIELTLNPSAVHDGMDYFRPSMINSLFSRVATSVTVLPFEPPRIVDVHQYYPIGSIDWDYLKEKGIIVQISVGIGMEQGARYLHQIEEARKRNIPVVLWHIPDVRYGMVEQVQEVFSWPYVKDYVFCMDVEKPRSTTRVINANEFKWYAQEIETQSRWQPMVYSSEWILRSIFGSSFPSWYQYHHWIAQYVYKSYPYLYEYFSDFEKHYACQLPPSVLSSTLFADPVHKASVVEWQFTHKGREPFVYPTGPLSRDLSFGLVPLERLLREVIHHKGEDIQPEPFNAEPIVRNHSAFMIATYLNNVDHFNNLGADMKATGIYPPTAGMNLEATHIVEAIAKDLGVTKVPYLYKGKVNTSKGLRVRKYPSSITGEVLRVLPNQSEITVYQEVSGSDDVYTWGKIDPAKSEWVATSHNLVTKL